MLPSRVAECYKLFERIVSRRAGYFNRPQRGREIAFIETRILRCCAVCFLSAHASAQVVRAVTEDNPNLHHAGPGHGVVGPGADLVREVAKRAGLQSDVKIFTLAARLCASANTSQCLDLFPWPHART